MKSEDERLVKFDSQAANVINAARLCQQNGYTIPAMMLIFAAKDGMAWLYREHEGENTGKDFTDWVDRFWITESGGITSDDLWGARNALLHEQSSNSRQTRSGKATALWYREKDSKAWVPLGGSWKEAPGFVRADEMITLFESAIARFREFIQSQDSQRRDQILDRCAQWFDLVSVDSFFRDAE